MVVEGVDGKNAMSTSADICFVCGGSSFGNWVQAYKRCLGCGHETLVHGQRQAFIINDPLDVCSARKSSALDHFKTRILIRYAPHHLRKVLLDIGSASGKFLLQNARHFKRVVGIEVTPEAAAFARDQLGLQVVDDITQIDDSIDMATAWHSFEHIPAPILDRLLSHLSNHMSNGGRLVISVPNGASLQYRLYRSAYAFFDVPNHLHQFTSESLRRLLARHGFRQVGSAFSAPYNTFGHIQALLNIITGTHNYLYYRLKRRSVIPSLRLDVLHVLLLPFALPVGWLLGWIEGLFPNKQGVLTLCFERTQF